jgi:hypothetical protein
MDPRAGVDDVLADLHESKIFALLLNEPSMAGA